MDEKTILIGVLTKTLNKSEQEATDLLYQQDGDELIVKESAMDDILSLDAKRVENIKKNAPVSADRLKNEYGRGKKEALDELESTLKDKYSIDSDKQGVELVDSILSAKSKPTKLSDDEVKKHPLYLDLEKKRVAREEYEKLESDYNNYKNTVEKTKKFSTVKGIARSVLQELKPIVSENPTVARTREEDFLAKFEAYEYQLDSDTPIVIKPDGTRLEDGHGNAKPFKEFVRELAMMNYDFPKQDDKGNTGQDPDKKKQFSFTIPTNDREYAEAVNNAKTVEEKVAIKEAYHAKK